jgi:FYVE/RhoGEF/PH domain-containing protein 1
VETLQGLEGDNLVTANTFYVRDDHKTVELYTASRREKEEWLEALFVAIKSLYTRKASLRVDEEAANSGGLPPVRDLLRPLDSEIGRRPPPHMQRPENVSKCADCAAQFSILKHKHNCRTCGAVRNYAKQHKENRWRCRH